MPSGFVTQFIWVDEGAQGLLSSDIGVNLRPEFTKGSGNVMARTVPSLFYCSFLAGAGYPVTIVSQEKGAIFPLATWLLSLILWGEKANLGFPPHATKQNVFFHQLSE